MRGGEHDEAISIYALQMQARRLLRRHCLPTPPLTMTPRNDNSEVFQHSPCFGVFVTPELRFDSNEKSCCNHPVIAYVPALI